MPDVSALVQQMQQTLTAIHETITSLDPTVHDEKLDALEAERDDVLAKLLAAFEKESTDLSEKRQHERAEIAEQRRKEDEEIAARRRREDEALQSRDLTEDEQREEKLAAERKDVEENTDHRMEEVEDEAERALNEGHEKLRDLEGKRQVCLRHGRWEASLRGKLTYMTTQEIHRMIDEQMKVPLPSPPKRKRRGTTTARSAPAGPTAAEASQPAEPQSQDRSIPVETSEAAAEPEPEPVKAEKSEEPVESKAEEETAPKEPAATEVKESQSSEQETAHPENGDEATKEVITEEKSVVPEETPAAEEGQSEEPAAAAEQQHTEEASIEKEAPPAEEPSPPDNKQPAAAAAEEEEEEVLANKVAVPEETTTAEAAPAAHVPAETETKPEDAAPAASDEPTATEDAIAGDRSVPEEVSMTVEESSATTTAAPAAAPEEDSQAEATPAAAVEEEATPAKEAPVEGAAAETQGLEESEKQHAETDTEAPVEGSSTQGNGNAEKNESAPESEAASQPRDLAINDAPEPQEAAEEEKADETEPAAENIAEPAAESTSEPAAEEEFKPRDLDAEKENSPALESAPTPTSEPVAEPVAEPAAEPAAEPVVEEEFKPRDLDAERENPPAPELTAESAVESVTEPAAEEEIKPRDLDAEQAAEPKTESAAEPPVEEDFKPRDLDAERESSPAPETAKPSTEQTEKGTGAETQTASDPPGESSEPVQQLADEHVTPAEQTAEQSALEGETGGDAAAEVSEQPEAPSAFAEPAKLSGKEESNEAVAHQEPSHEEPAHEEPANVVTREVDESHLDSTAKDVSDQQEHTPAADEGNAAPAGIVEGGAAEEYLEMAKADAAEPQPDDVAAPQSEEHPSTNDSAPVAEAHVEPSQEATPKAEEPSVHEAPEAGQEEPEASSDQPRDRDINSGTHEAQSETQGAEIVHHETPAAEEVKEQHETEVKGTPQTEEHATEDADKKQVESIETPAEAEQPSQSEPEPDHKPSETAEQVSEPEQTTAMQETEDRKDAEPVPTAREVVTDDHDSEAPVSVEETKAPAEETQDPVEEAKVSTDATPAAEAQAEETQAAAADTHTSSQDDRAIDAPSDTPADEPTEEAHAPTEDASSSALPILEASAEDDTREITKTESPSQGQSSEPADTDVAAPADTHEAQTEQPGDDTGSTTAGVVDEASAVAEAPAEGKKTTEPADDSAPATEAPPSVDHAENSLEKESGLAPSSEAPTSEEPAVEAPATEPAHEEAAAVDEIPHGKEASAIEETPTLEETPAPREISAAEESPALEESAAVERTRANAPSAESKAENPTEETTINEILKEVPAAETHHDDSTAASANAPVEDSTDQPSSSHEVEPTAEASVEPSAEKSVAEPEAVDSAASTQDPASHNDDVHEEKPSREAHKVEQPAQASEEPENAIPQDATALDSQPQEIHHDDHESTNEPHSAKEPESLSPQAEAKDVAQPDEHEHSEHEGGEKMSDSGYDSALTGSRTLDDLAGQHHFDEPLSAVQEDMRSADDELHPAEAEIQDQKEEQQSEIHEGAGNVISPSKGGDVQDSGNSQAAETFEDGAPQASEPATEEAKHEVANTEVFEKEQHPAEESKEVPVEQSVQAEDQGTGPASAQIGEPEPVQESNVQVDHAPESHEEQEASSPKELPEQTPRDLDTPAATLTEANSDATNDSHDMATPGVKASDPIERSLPSTEPTESEHLVQEPMEAQQGSVPATAADEEKPSAQPHKTEATREAPSQEVESQNLEPAEDTQESAPYPSSSIRRESKPTIDLPTRSGHDDPDEGLFAVPPTPREEVDGSKPAQLQHDSTEQDRPNGTVDAPLDLGGPKEAPQQERQIEAEASPKADLPQQNSQEEYLRHSTAEEPQMEQDLPAEHEAAPRVELATPSADTKDSDGHSQVEMPAAAQVHDVQTEAEKVAAPSSYEEPADVHASDNVQDREIHDDSVPAAETRSFQAEPSPEPVAVAHNAHDQDIAGDESKESYNVSPVSSDFESAYSERRDEDAFQTPYEQAQSAVMQRDLSYGGRFEDEDDHDNTLHAMPAVEPQQPQDFSHEHQRFEQALGQVPDETSAHTVSGTDQLFDDSYDDDSGSVSEYGEAVVSPPERIVYQAHGDDHNVALGGNHSSTSLGRNSIASARSLEPTTPVRVTDGSYLPGANIVRADWAGEHEEELRAPSQRGTPRLEPHSSQDSADISPFALRNPPATEEPPNDKGLSSSRWNPQRPSTPPPVPPKKLNNPFRTPQTPEPATTDADLMPRDVTNLPWHARNDSIPASMHSQTTLSSVASSPIHSALPADKHEPVIRDSWVPAPGYQQYLSSWTGRTRGDSAVSNNSEYDPFKADAVGGTAPVKSSSIYNPFQARSRAESSVSAAPSNTSAAAPPSSNASPGRGSALFQKMRNIFEAQNANANATPDPNASMEPMRSPHRRPPSGNIHPTFTPTQQQLSSSERLREQVAYDPYHEPGSTRDDAEPDYDERFGLLRGSHDKESLHSGAAGNEHAAHR